MRISLEYSGNIMGNIYQWIGFHSHGGIQMDGLFHGKSQPKMDNWGTCHDFMPAMCSHLENNRISLETIGGWYEHYY